MKKFLAFACAAVLLAGCGSSEPKKETKTCSMSQAGIGIDIKMDAEDDIIKTMELTMLMPESLTKVDASKLSEDDLKKAGEAGLANIGVKEGEEGVTVAFKAKDKDLQLSVIFDLDKASADVLKKLNLTESTKDVKLSDTVKGAEQSNFTCK